MKIDPVFDTVFSRLYGKPCWSVWKGIGSFLTLNFGKPHLRIREPIAAHPGASKYVRESLERRNAIVKGDWRLWIYCCDWEVRNKGRLIGRSSSSDKRIEQTARFLNGEKLVHFTLLPKGVRCVFEFDLRTVLETKPFSKNHEQWLLFEPDLVFPFGGVDGV